MSKIQGKGVKNSTEIVAGGGAIADLITDDQIYISGSSINKTLKQAIIDNNIGGAGVGSVDNLLTQSFDSAQLSEFIQTGLSLVTSPVIQGSKTARLIHQAATTQSFKYIKAVDNKYKGKNLTMSFQVRSSATAGNVTLNVYDETNAANLILSQSITLGSSTITATTNSNTTLSGISSSDINKIKVGETITGSGIPTGTLITAINISALTATISQAATASATVTLKNSDLPQKQSASFDVPNNCASISYTISALAESGLPETYVDDVVIQLTSAALTSTSVTVPVNNDTEWASYTPTFTGFGTVTNIAFFYRRVGSNVHIRGRYTLGTTTATEAQMTLPTGLVSSASISSLEVAGSGSLNFTGAAYLGITPLIEPSKGYITFGMAYSGGGIAELSKSNGNNFNNGLNASINAIIPIQGWAANETTSKTIPLTSAVFATQPDSQMTWFTMTGYASTRTRVPYFSAPRNMIGSAISLTSGSINGLEVTVQESGYYDIHWEINVQGSGETSHYAIGLNSTDFTTAFTALRSDFLDYKYRNGANESSVVHLAYSGPLSAGDKIYPLGNSSTSFINLPNTSFAISKVGSTKQINISSDQKIDLPTSELIMGEFNGTASTNNVVCKFNGIQKIVGDAFTVVNDPALGFSLTMKKSGYLHINASIVTSGTAHISLSKNATQFTTNPNSMTAGQNIAANFNGNTEGCPLVWYGRVNVGDVFRCHSAAISAGSTAATFGQGFQAFFSETNIQVSLSNVLPQFTQSDSSVRNTVGAGKGLTNTYVRRFSNTPDNFGSSITYSDSSNLGASYTINEDGTYEISYVDSYNAITTFGIVKNGSGSGQLGTFGTVLATATASGANHSNNAAWSGQLVKGDVIRPVVYDLNADGTLNAFVSFTISKVGKPNLTSVDVTPFTNYKGTDTEVIKLSGGNGFGSTNTKIRRFSTVDNNTNLGVLRYSDDAALGTYITVLRNCVAEISYSDVANSTNTGWIGLVLNSNQNTTAITSLTDGVVLANMQLDATAATDYSGTISSVVKLNVGDILRCHQGTNVCKTNGTYQTSTIKCNLQIKAVAEADQIVSPISSFSSDTASLVYASSSSYTLSTLASAPVGTFITFTASAASNAQTQTTTAPTQSVSDMSVNGIQITGRGFNQTSTASAPAIVAIQIGKGFKGVQVNGYRTTSKTGVVSLDNQLVSSTINTGLSLKDYNENTGVLIIDAAYDRLGSTNNRYFINDDFTNVTLSTAYLVINASKSPSLAAVPQLQPRIAVISDVRASGTSGGSVTTGSFITRPLNTVDDPTGIVAGLASNQFTLPVGTYKITASAPTTGSDITKAKIRNITDSTDAIIGQSSMIQSVNTIEKATGLEGYVTITSNKTFELQQRFTTNAGTSAMGYASSFGVNEVYAIVTIQKIK